MKSLKAKREVFGAGFIYLHLLLIISVLIVGFFIFNNLVGRDTSAKKPDNKKAVLIAQGAGQFPVLVYDTKIVYIRSADGGLTSNLYLYNVSTNQETLLEANWPVNRELKDFYGDKIVFEIETSLSDIYVFNIDTLTEELVTTRAQGGNIHIWDNKIVFDDNSADIIRPCSSEPSNLDIYLYDLNTNIKARITTSPNDQVDPDIYENLIVWSEGFNDCIGSATTQNIVKYDLTTGVEARLTNEDFVQERPRVFGNNVLWDDQRFIFSSIFGYSLLNNLEYPVQEETNQDGVSLGNQYAVWTGLVGNSQGLYAKKLQSSHVTALGETTPGYGIWGDLAAWSSGGSIYYQILN